MYSDFSHQDKIILPRLSFVVCHGVLPQEKKTPQEFVLSLTLWLDTTQAAETDDIADTVDYAEVYAEVERIMQGPPHNLLESLASEIAHALLADELVQKVCVRLEKASAPVGRGIPAAVEIERTAADYGVC